MSALLYGNVEFDQSTSLYTYIYIVQNDTLSTIWDVNILVGNTALGTYLGLQPLVPQYTAPDGWTMFGSYSGYIAGPPWNESGGFYHWNGEPTQNTTITGFSVTTRFAPTDDNGLNDYFLFGSQGIVGYGNVVVPNGADWLYPFPVAGVPESATWLMMMLGFAVIGLSCRRAATVPWLPNGERGKQQKIIRLNHSGRNGLTLF